MSNCSTRRGRGSLPSTWLPSTSLGAGGRDRVRRIPALGDRQLAADNRFDAGRERCLMESRCSIHPVSIEQGERGISQRGRPVDQGLGQGSAIKKRESGRGMELDIHGEKKSGSSQRSVQFWSVSMANKSSIVSDLHGWRTPSVSGEELQAPGKSGPQETAESRGACQFQGAKQSARVRPSGRTSAKVEAALHESSWFVAL